MQITTARFGSIAGRTITEFTLNNGNGMLVRIIDYGGIITQLQVPGRQEPGDVVLGFDDLGSYVRNCAFVGAIIGRCANRIAGASFTLDGTTWQLDVNEPPNHLHGGFQGFHRQCWRAEAYAAGDDLCLSLTRRSPAGEGGYPGNLDIAVIYRLTRDNSLDIDIAATTDQATPVSITQHSYFNLAGHNSGDIRHHQLQLFADTITESDCSLLPTGNLLPVAKTPYDFLRPAAIGEQLRHLPGGYDVNYAVRGVPGELRPAALLHEPVSGRNMEVRTTLPGLQLYDGQHLAAMPQPGKGGCRYPQNGGLCLETQHFPDAVNRSEFPSPILRPGESYHHTTTFTFRVR